VLSSIPFRPIWTRSIPWTGRADPISDAHPGLVETEASDPAERTKRNVRDADATLLVSHGPLVGGSLLTANEARRLDRPLLHVDLHALSVDAADPPD
jgi:hypothetical protein